MSAAEAGDGNGREPRGRRRRIGRALALGLALVLAVLLLAPAALILLYRAVPPPGTPLMVLRAAEGRGWDYRWTPLARIAPALARAVLTAEDEAFCAHAGFDTKALRKAWEAYQDSGGSTLRGGSTISQQTAKNLLLWPGRTWVRKGLEAWLTVYIEALWPKRRIMEVYLNVAEWGSGVYGAEAAARRHFGKSAAALSAAEAARLAAVLPSPLRWSAAQPGPYVQQRARILEGRAARLGPLAACLAA